MANPYLGPQGIILSQLERAFPGAYIWFFMFTILIGVLFMYKISKIEENTKEVFGYFALLGMMSLILTGNMATFIGLMVICVSVWFVMRHVWKKAETVTSGERAIEQRYFPQETEFRRGAEAIERSIEAKERGKAPDVAMLAKEEREVETIEEYEDIIVAAEKDLSVKIQLEVAAEKSAIEKEQAMVSALVGYGNSMEQQLQSMGSMQVIDTAGRRAVLNTVQNMSLTCNQIFINERDINKTRLQFVVDLAEDVDAVKDVTNHARTLSKGASQIGKILSRGLGNSIITVVSVVLQAKRAKLGALYTAMWAAKASKNKGLVEQIKIQIDKLKEGIARLKGELNTLKAMRAQLKGPINEVRKVLGDIRSILNTLVSAEKNAVRHEKKIISFQKNFQQSMRKLEVAVASFAASVNVLAKEQGGIAEEVPIKATTGVGGMFTEIFNLQDTALKLNSDGALPFTDDMLAVLRDSMPLGPLMQGLHAGFQKINAGFQSLVSAASSIEGVAARLATLADEAKMLKLQSSVESVAVNQEQARARMTQEAMGALQASRSAIESNIVQITTGQRALQNSQSQLLSELTRSLSAITMNKARVDTEFQRNANQFTSQMAQAQQKVEQARKAA